MSARSTQPQRPPVYHSDRGLHYAAREYVGPRESPGVALRMPQHGDPYENAGAERANGILQDEFGRGDTLPGFAQAEALVRRAVRAYNELRPHGSGDFLTPNQAHEQPGPLVRRWKNYDQPITAPAPT